MLKAVLVMPTGITDPQEPRGPGIGLVAVLGAAVGATLAGAASYWELGSVAAGPRNCCPCWRGWDLVGWWLALAWWLWEIVPGWAGVREARHGPS